MSKIAYYLFLKPISYVPLSILYLAADLMYVVLIYIIPYRKAVISTNIANSFPDKSPKEVKQITRRFYRYFADLAIETVWNFSLTEKQVRKRLKVENPEI